ncbi:hypothetical protein GBA52_002252 [Prunus armeniaca]|nr:hypothetical protein GBA52_002252 [Prunus armeniaca]
MWLVCAYSDGPLGLNNSQASVLLSPPPMPMPMPCGQDVYASKLFFCRSNSTVVVVTSLSPNMEPGRMVEDFGCGLIVHGP